MKELSIFIDESGDFGEITERPAYYLVTLLFHDQKNEIASSVKRLEDSIKNSGFDFDYIHRCRLAEKSVNTGKIEKYSNCRSLKKYRC